MPEDESRENVILFPKWKTILEEESLLALEKKQYEVALEKLNKLISFDVSDHEIVFGKLICLMELEHYDEAEELCEHLLAFGNENYYHYVHVYLTILFQTDQYDRVMEQIENEFIDEGIPDLIKEQFQQLYDMSKQMKQDIINRDSIQFIGEFYESIHGEDFSKQWRLIENLRKLKVTPPEEVIRLLTESHIHPVVKTVVFKWLQDLEINEDIEIHKFNKQMHVNPSKITEIREHTVTKQTLLLISEIEQKNPTLYILLVQLLYRYIYVLYPIVPSSSEVNYIAEALMAIGERYLDIEIDAQHNEHVDKFIEDIQMCETMYLSVIEE